jgi:parallel beta helix pectate lyase-like protein
MTRVFPSVLSLANTAVARHRAVASGWDDFIVKEKTTMKTIKLAFISLLITLAASLPALAVPRVFVSGLGNDANPGSITSPKRSFASALTVTDAGGEIIVLDSAGYGPVTINKSVSITSPTGVYAGITVASGYGVEVSIGGSDVVVLRGLTINGAVGNTASGGIHLSPTPGGQLHVEGCVISGFTSQGSAILVEGSQGHLYVIDTICRGNWNGINIQGGNNTLDRVRMTGNLSTGLSITGQSSFAAITNSVASGSTYGFACFGSPATDISVEACQSSNNTYGILVDGGTLRVSNSTVTANTNGLYSQNGTLKSRGNNTVDGNSTNTTGPITPLSGM